MDSLLLTAAVAGRTEFDASRFELRRSAAGVDVLCAKGEVWTPHSGSAYSGSSAGAGGAGLGGAAAMLSAVVASTASASHGGGRPAGVAAPAKTYKASELSLEDRFASVRLVGEECIQEEELLALLKVKAHPVCYDGFEPSGRMHIAQGILKAINVNRLTKAGCVFKFWVADWFALLNNKMGGDLKKIRTVGLYMIEVGQLAA